MFEIFTGSRVALCKYVYYTVKKGAVDLDTIVVYFEPVVCAIYDTMAREQ